MEEIRKRLDEEFRKQLEKFEAVKTYDEMSYDELYNEIMLNTEDIDTLMTIADLIRFNPRLTEFEKERLWDLIDKYAGKRG